MILGSIYTFLVGGVVGVVIAVGVLTFLKRNRIVEKKTDPIYYRIFSKKKNNLRKIVEYLEKNKKISKKKVVDLINVSETSASTYLNELQEAHLVVKDKNDRYKLVK